jgi:hypothetical protein
MLEFVTKLERYCKQKQYKLEYSPAVAAAVILVAAGNAVAHVQDVALVVVDAMHEHVRSARSSGV